MQAASRALLLVALLGGACGGVPTADAERVAPASTASAPADTVRTDWGRFFDAEAADGTFVLYDAATGRTHRYHPERAAQRVIPASTFKVYNSLVALDTGVAPDVDTAFAWDGVARSRGWDRDHSLRSGVRTSALWLFQRLAREIGPEGYRAAFAREPYGNSALGEDVALFWLDGPLMISADEQVVFLDRLRRGALSFRRDHQAAVRDIMVLENGDGYTLRGKTGWARPSWATPPEADLGWIVGWIERDASANVFALNVEAAGPGFDMSAARHAILYGILDDLGLRPLGAAPGE